MRVSGETLWSSRERFKYVTYPGNECNREKGPLSGIEHHNKFKGVWGLGHWRLEGGKSRGDVLASAHAMMRRMVLLANDTMMVGIALDGGFLVVGHNGDQRRLPLFSWGKVQERVSRSPRMAVQIQLWEHRETEERRARELQTDENSEDQWVMTWGSTRLIYVS